MIGKLVPTRAHRHYLSVRTTDAGEFRVKPEIRTIARIIADRMRDERTANPFGRSKQ